MDEKGELRKDLLKKRTALRQARKEFDAALQTNDLVTIQHAQEKLNDALRGVDALRDEAQDDIGITQMRSSKMSETIAKRIVETSGTERILKRYQK
jgi:hypothetical protein